MIKGDKSFSCDSPNVAKLPNYIMIIYTLRFPNRDASLKTGDSLMVVHFLRETHSSNDLHVVQNSQEFNGVPV